MHVCRPGHLAKLETVAHFVRRLAPAEGSICRLPRAYTLLMLTQAVRIPLAAVREAQSRVFLGGVDGWSVLATDEQPVVSRSRE